MDFEPARGGGADKRRPAIIVSNDASNAAAARLGRGVVTVVPLTSSVRTAHEFQVILAAGETGLRRDSKAQAEQVRAVDVERVGPLIGRLHASEISAVDRALRLHLDL